MSEEKPDRPKLSVDAPEEIRLAVILAAKKRGISRSQLVCEILSKALAEELADARKYTPPRKQPKGHRRQRPESSA